MFSQASKTFLWQCDQLSIAKATTFPKRPLIQNTKLLPSQITKVIASDRERFLMLNFLHLMDGSDLYRCLHVRCMYYAAHRPHSIQRTCRELLVTTWDHTHLKLQKLYAINYLP